MITIDPAFAFHKLNETGKRRAVEIAEAFSELLVDLGPLGALGGREGALVKTKLEEACFFAKKSMAVQAENQDAG